MYALPYYQWKDSENEKGKKQFCLLFFHCLIRYSRGKPLILKTHKQVRISFLICSDVLALSLSRRLYNIVALAELFAGKWLQSHGIAHHV
jgi:hypothetical protein